MPVKLSDELVRLAREEASAADRSITAQIEHWAKLGRSVETALRHDDVLALKEAQGDLDRVFPDAPTRQAVYTLLEEVASVNDRSGLARSLAKGNAVYQSDPSGSGLIMRIERDGHRTVGRFENRRFVAVRQEQNHTAR